MYTVHPSNEGLLADAKQKRTRQIRILLFVSVFLLVAGGGLIYDFSRPAVYRATTRLTVEPPGVGDDAVVKAQFAISEAQAVRRSDLMQLVMTRIRESAGSSTIDIGELERQLTAEAVPQTSVIELRAEGNDRNQLVAALSAWIDVYTSSRKDTDRLDESEAIDEARHVVLVAQKAIEDKRRDMEAFRQRHGIISIERDENPSAARLRGLHNALNDASTREVNAEARLKAVTDNLAQGKGVIRAVDKTTIANLEMRAVDLREKIKDLEHDYTQQYLALDPKFKALKANLSRLEQQVAQEKDRSQKEALLEAQEEFAGAQRAAQKIREQADSLKQESQVFSTRFVELKRMGTELEQLQEARRIAAERLAKLDSARKPSAVRIRVLSAPWAGDDPISPNYSRDAAIALAAGLALALAAVWTHDFLRRESQQPVAPATQPIIQIAYPMLQPHTNAANVALQVAPTGLLGISAPPQKVQELNATDVSALWKNASSEGRLIISAIFSGLAPSELVQLAWKHVDLARGTVEVPGPSTRSLALLEPMRHELTLKVDGGIAPMGSDIPLLADGAGNAFDEAAIDRQLAFAAHDSGLRHPEEITGQVLHFTYAAFLARQGIRMSDLAATIGRIAGPLGSELMRLAPPGLALSVDRIERVFPSFRTT